MKSLDSNVKKSGTDYNPAKYIRGFKLLNGVNVSELPNVQNSKKIEKYSYEEYLKIKNPNASVGNASTITSNLNNVNNPTTKLDNSPNKFSYDQYKMKKQLNKSGDKIVQDDYSKFPNTFSNKMNMTNTPPKTFLNSGNNLPIQNNPNNFLNFELTKSGMNQTTILTPLEGNQFGEQVKDTNSFNPYSALSFDMTPQQPKVNYGGSYVSGNNNMNNRSTQLNPNYGMNFNMPNYNNGYGLNNPNNYNMNNLPNNNNNYNPGNLKFPK